MCSVLIGPICTVVSEWIYFMDVCVAPGFLLLLEKTEIVKTKSK